MCCCSPSCCFLHLIFLHCVFLYSNLCGYTESPQDIQSVVEQLNKADTSLYRFPGNLEEWFDVPVFFSGCHLQRACRKCRTVRSDTAGGLLNFLMHSEEHVQISYLHNLQMFNVLLQEIQFMSYAIYTHIRFKLMWMFQSILVTSSCHTLSGSLSAFLLTYWRFPAVQKRI